MNNFTVSEEEVSVKRQKCEDSDDSISLGSYSDDSESDLESDLETEVSSDEGDVSGGESDEEVEFDSADEDSDYEEEDWKLELKIALEGVKESLQDMKRILRKGGDSITTTMREDAKFKCDKYTRYYLN